MVEKRISIGSARDKEGQESSENTPFNPSDGELLKGYLWNKCDKLPLPSELVQVATNVYERHPENLWDEYNSNGSTKLYLFVTPWEWPTTDQITKGRWEAIDDFTRVYHHRVLAGTKTLYVFKEFEPIDDSKSERRKVWFINEYSQRLLIYYDDDEWKIWVLHHEVEDESLEGSPKSLPKNCAFNECGASSSIR